MDKEQAGEVLGTMKCPKCRTRFQYPDRVMHGCEACDGEVECTCGPTPIRTKLDFDDTSTVLKFADFISRHSDPNDRGQLGSETRNAMRAIEAALNGATL